MTAVNVYAKSLIQADNNFDAIQNDLSVVRNIMESSNDLKNVLESPVISDVKKNEIIESVFKGQIGEKVLNFLKILVDKKRIGELFKIIEAYEAEIERINNIQRVEVVSAVELNDEQKNKIVEKLQKRFNKTIVPKWVSDEEIIAGLIVKTDDNVIDNSLRKKLKKISKI